MNVDRVTQKSKNIPEELKEIIGSEESRRKLLIILNLFSLNYKEVKSQLRKISQLILQNLQSDLK